MTLSNLTEAEKTILMDETVTDLKQSLETAIKSLLAEYETDLETNLNISKVEVNFIVKLDGVEV
ncbi:MULTISPECIES: hypothetical protein [Methanosarcina]|jgi:hypothetical protein|uniref:Uncharacterized protein n=3 Tax=Methanosarcina mazei TaxID=2209 RepID=A0A0F8KPR9_METMZ|nr:MULTISPECIES: hypothetical protein [Methanosarcina]AAM32698.1 hypothetical protein MM_3002 [Methanosarcina mazei Go1]AGF98348.1 hypothetical protein MmTuc01_3086 [Methanosarcina mazei Tuc01]KKG00790.1 hypothetical protein DU31_17020 [Methanosarcina mazei]KKG04538.1 hypothetical protein DU47_06725 [Methanosarcina mazei]KKG04915.1 hypothetical protein DU40_07365 [Methanosarcina mazei]